VSAELPNPSSAHEPGTVDPPKSRLLLIFGLRRGQQFARLVIAKRRGLTFAAFRPRPLDAFDRVVGDGILLAETLDRFKSAGP
jgi:hypothetical protein